MKFQQFCLPPRKILLATPGKTTIGVPPGRNPSNAHAYVYERNQESFVDPRTFNFSYTQLWKVSEISSAIINSLHVSGKVCVA